MPGPANAQPDYPPALWNPAYPGHWYTTGNAHDFVVIHDMEGYYLATISYFQQSGTQASAHFCVNGLQNGSDTSGHNENNPNDKPAGEITQMVREQYWAWHVRCWNRFTLGTEHEGFVSNPVWYTETMYRTSAGLQRHLCNTFNIPMDRNHIIGHNQWQSAAWVNWMRTNYPAMDPTCNDHTDPGQFWDWAHFMSLITNPPAITDQPLGQTVDPGANVDFSVSVVGATPLSYQWRRDGVDVPGATASVYSLVNAQLAQAGVYSVMVTNLAGAALSSNAELIVRSPPIISSQPLAQTVTAGQEANFRLEVVGSTPLNFQWRFNGTNLPGATTSALTLPAVRQVDSGLYSATVTNAYGWALSSNAELSVAFIAAWGDNSFEQTNIPPVSTNLIAVAAGSWHTLALRADGRVLAWGSDFAGQCDPPGTLTDAVAVAAGGYHSLAIRADGSVVGWGANDYGQTTVPSGLRNVVAVAGGTWHSLALKADGSVQAWGDNSFGQTNLPPGLTNVVAVAAGGNHSLALTGDGRVMGWGENTDSGGIFVGQSVVPNNASNAVLIAAGEYFSLALRRDGSFVAWGDNSEGQCNFPAGLTNVVAIAAGSQHTLALLAAGRVAAWGANLGGQCDVPVTWTNVQGIAAGDSHTVLLVEGYRPVLQMLRPSWAGDKFTAIIQTVSRANYTLEFKGPLGAPGWAAAGQVSGNGGLRMVTDQGASAPSRFYRVRAW